MLQDPLGNYLLEGYGNGSEGTMPAPYTPPVTPSPSSPFKKKGTFQVAAPTDPNKFTGYDFGTHNGRTYSYDNPAEGAKYAVSNYLNSVDPNSDWAQGAADYLNSQYGGSIFKADGGKRLSYGDEFVDSDPTRFGGKFFWGAAGGAGGGSGSAGSSAGSGSASAQAMLTGGQGTVQDAIARLLARGEKGVTRDDIRQQYEPVAANMERQKVKAQAQSAQRRAVEGTGAQGGGGGANDSDLNSINEDLASRQSGLEAELMGQEIQARRADVVNALQFAQGEERMALERQLAQMNNELQRLSIGNQNSQFYDNLSWNMSSSNQNSMLQQLLNLFS